MLSPATTEGEWLYVTLCGSGGHKLLLSYVRSIRSCRMVTGRTIKLEETKRPLSFPTWTPCGKD